MKGELINLGSTESGSRSNAMQVLKDFGVDYPSDITATSIPFPEAAAALQDGMIDAYFYTVGHPNSSFKEASCGVRRSHFVDITGPEVDAIIKEFPFFTHSTICIKDYPHTSNKENVETFGVKAMLCTSAHISDDIVYTITKEVFENFTAFKALHPAYATLEKENLLEALSAPIHPGAMKYYKEVGLIQ